MKSRIAAALLSLRLATVVFPTTPLYSFQQAPKLESSADAELTILAIEGEGGINNIKKGTATKPVVEIRDRNNLPVAGTAVKFILPQYGAGATFLNGSKFVTLLTDSRGRAAITAMKANKAARVFRIAVNASYNGHTAVAAISQTNAIAGAAAAEGAEGGTASGAAGGTAAGVSAGVIGGVVAGVAAIAVVVAKVVTTTKPQPPRPHATIGLVTGQIVVGGPRYLS